MQHDVPVLDAKGLRQFALATSAILTVLFGLALPWLFGLDYPLWPWVLAILLTVWGLLAPTTLGPVYRTWMRFGSVMNRVTTPLVLGIVFFLVISPVAFVMKVVRRDSMSRSFDSACKSYRVVSTKPSKKSMERPY